MASIITNKPKLHQRKLTIMAMVLVTVFVICNSFYSIYFILRGLKIISSKATVSQYLYPIACLFTVLNSSVNVIIYGIFDMKFRRVFLSLFCGICLPQSSILKKETSTPLATRRTLSSAMGKKTSTTLDTRGTHGRNDSIALPTKS